MGLALCASVMWGNTNIRMGIVGLALLALPILEHSAHSAPKSIALGGEHSCVLTYGGGNIVKCWGNNDHGQLGNGKTVPSAVPVTVGLTPKDVPIAIAAGVNHSCSLLDSGIIKCWGDNSSGQLGTGKISSLENMPVSVVTIGNAKLVATGLKHSCAILTTGKINCWGNNQFGQLGNDSLAITSTVPVEVKTINNAIDLALGDNHSCALLSTGKVTCWGSNNYGQLGVTSNMLPKSATPVSIDLNATALETRGDQICAIMTDKSVKCWGWNGYNYAGSTLYTSQPTPIAELKNIGALALGRYFACALDYTVTAKPQMKCWGVNYHGELGLGNISNFVYTPTTVNIADPITTIAAGDDHSCVNTTINGIPILKCWGNNTFGQLGLDPQSSGLKSDPKVPGLKFSIAAVIPVDIKYIATASSAVTPSTPPPAPTPPACIYTYSNWGTCQLQSWGYWQTRIALSASPAGCTGTPVQGQSCVPVSVATSTSTADSGCASQWYYAKNGSISGPYSGCQDIPDSIDNDPLKWCAMKPAYFSGKQNGTDWTYCANGGASKCVRGPWYFSNRNGFHPGPYQGCSNPDKDRGGAWCPTKITYVSGGKQNIDWKYCGAGTDLLQSPTSAALLEKSWNDQKASIAALLNELGKVAADTNYAKQAFTYDIKTTIEPYLTDILTKKKVTIPSTPSSIASKEDYKKTFQKLKDNFQKINIALMGLMTPSADTNPAFFDYKTRDILAQMALAQFYSLLVGNIDYLEAGSTSCAANIIQVPHIYNYASTVLESPNYEATIKNSLGATIKLLQCSSQKDANILDEKMTVAFKITMQIVQATRPKYASAIRDILLRTLSPILFNVYERTRLQGDNVPSKKFLKLYADRLNNGMNNDFTGVNMEPPYFMLYNPGSKQIENLYLSAVPPKDTPAGQLPVWNEVWKQIYWKNFVKAALDPEWNTALTCSLWDSARLGKKCEDQPLPTIKTSWLERAHEIFQDWIMPTAYALEKCPAVTCGVSANAGFCQKPNLWSNYYYKCNPQQGGTVLFESCDDSDNTCDAFLKACAADCAVATGGDKATCASCIPTPACDDFAFLFINDKNKAKVVQTTQLSYTDENGNVVCPPGSPYSCGIPYTLKKCLSGNPTCSAKGYPNDKEGCSLYDPGKQKDRCTACTELQVCKKSIKQPGEKPDPLYTQAFCDKCTYECSGVGCGNGKIDTGEDCDDGTDNGTAKSKTGCSATCKKEKKGWCEECFFPKFKGKSKDCDLFFQLDQDSKDPTCTVPYTPWDESNCSDEKPYKKGDPCAFALPLAAESCMQSKERAECFRKCRKSAPIPPENLSQCLELAIPKLPAWLNGFGANTKKEITDYLKAVSEMSIYGKTILAMKQKGADRLEERWNDIIALFEKINGITIDTAWKQEALEYGLELLVKAQECQGTDLEDIKKDKDVAIAMPGTPGYICWNPEKVKDEFIEEAIQTGAHEAAHAALDILWNYYPLNQSSSGTGLCKYGKYQVGDIDHWIMDIISYQIGTKKINVYENIKFGTKSKVCPLIQ